MIYQPMNANPNNVTIDGSLANTFSFEFSGNKLSSFKIYATLNGSSTAVYTSAQTTFPAYNGDTVSLSVPSGTFTNGNTYLWYVTQYEENPTMFIAGNTVVSTSTTTNVYIGVYTAVKANMYLKINGQSRQISSYNSTTGLAVVSTAFPSIPSVGATWEVYSNFITATSAFSFKVKALPVQSISNILSTITARHYTFLGAYTQAQNTEVKYHRWSLYDTSNNTIDDTGNVYSSYLSYSFDGFISGNGYTIKLLTMNNDGIETITTETFTVSYSAPVVSAPPKIEFLDDKNAVKLYYYGAKQNTPVTTGATYSIVDSTVFPDNKQLEITNGEITYNHDTFDNMSVMLQFVPLNTTYGNICEIDGITITFDGITFYKVVSDVQTKISDIVSFTETKLILQPTFEQSETTNYVWDDDMLWDDTYYWNEPDIDVSQYVFKIYCIDGNVSVYANKKS